MVVYLIILIYVLATLLVFRLKPEKLFDKDGNVKQFGSDNLFSLHSLTIALGVLLTFVLNFFV